MFPPPPVSVFQLWTMFKAETLETNFTFEVIDLTFKIIYLTVKISKASNRTSNWKATENFKQLQHNLNLFNVLLHFLCFCFNFLHQIGEAFCYLVLSHIRFIWFISQTCPYFSMTYVDAQWSVVPPLFDERSSVLALKMSISTFIPLWTSFCFTSFHLSQTCPCGWRIVAFSFRTKAIHPFNFPSMLHNQRSKHLLFFPHIGSADSNGWCSYIVTWHLSLASNRFPQSRIRDSFSDICLSQSPVYGRR